MELMIALFFQYHYEGQEYEIGEYKDGYYREANLIEEGKTYKFYTLDTVDKKFTASSYNTSYVYQLIGKNELLDIKRDVFNANEVLTYLDFYFDNKKHLKNFLSDQKNIDLFYDKLSFSRNQYGNLWLVGLDPIYDYPSFTRQDVFAEMADISMLWSEENSVFQFRDSSDFVLEISQSSGKVEVNNGILFLALTPGGYFSVDELAPIQDNDDLLVYEGEFKIGDSMVPEYYKITVTDLQNLPHAKIKMVSNSQEISGITPLSLIGETNGSFSHFNLTESNKVGSIKELTDLVYRTVDENLVRKYLDEIEKL